MAFPVDVFPKTQGCHLGSIISALRSPAPKPCCNLGLYTSWLGVMGGCPVWGKTWRFLQNSNFSCFIIKTLGNLLQ